MGYLKWLVLNSFTDSILTEFYGTNIFHGDVVGPTDTHFIIIVDNSGYGVAQKLCTSKGKAIGEVARTAIVSL